MRRLAIMLVAVFMLVGQIPLKKWAEIPLEKRKEFLLSVVERVCETEGCAKAKIWSEVQDDKVLIYWECLDGKEIDL